ncbi:MAG: energy transducer TonB [Betaproteobacteria bacterium]|nr:MAG: energy transducer TonB [Betaproteobacteria bacterium]
MSSSAVTAGLVRPFTEESALFRCVLASIALHALVLLGMSRGDTPAPPVKTLLVLTATLAPLAAAPHAPVQPPQPTLAPPPPPEPVSAPRPALTKPAAAPTPAAQKTAPAEPAKAPPPEPPTAAPGSAASSTQPAASVLARTAPQAPAGIPATEAAAKSGNEADKGTLEQYRLALIVATRRYKRYPAIAMEKGWQGKVEVHMVIGANGMLANASIKTGSGHEILDNQALDMLKKGKTTVPIPVSLRGREFSIDVPVIFNLDNPNS